jgi:hypothetical protein
MDVRYVGDIECGALERHAAGNLGGIQRAAHGGIGLQDSGGGEIAVPIVYDSQVDAAGYPRIDRPLSLQRYLAGDGQVGVTARQTQALDGRSGMSDSDRDGAGIPQRQVRGRKSNFEFRQSQFGLDGLRFKRGAFQME